MAEARLYARITLDFADSAKIKPLSDKAFRQFIESILWSRRMLSDGFIPTKMTRILFTEEVFEELTTNDDVNPSLRLVDGGVVIHDFTEHQTTRALVEQKQANGSKGGRAKAANTSSENVAPATTLLEQNASKSLAKTETETETETVTSNEVTKNLNARFDEFWEIYPRKASKAKAKDSFLVKAKQTDVEIILDGARRYANDPNRSESFTKNPLTWLNQECWDDDPLPPRMEPSRAKLKEQEREQAAAEFMASFNQPLEITTEPDWA